MPSARAMPRSDCRSASLTCWREPMLRAGGAPPTAPYVMTARRCLSWLIVGLLLVGCEPYIPPLRPGETGRKGWVQIVDGPLPPRRGAFAAWVQDRFVVVGGWGDPPCAPNAACSYPPEPAFRDGATFDPARAGWQVMADAPVPISAWEYAVLGDRLFLLSRGGNEETAPESFLSYDVGDDIWQVLPLPPGASPTLLAADGAVVAITSSNETTATRDASFDPGTRQWSRLPVHPIGDAPNRQAAWLDGKLWLAAGSQNTDPDDPSRSQLAVWDPGVRTWDLVADGPAVEWGPTAAAGRLVWTVVSYDGIRRKLGKPYHHGAVLDPASGTWRPVPGPPRSRGFHHRIMPMGDAVFTSGHLLDPRQLAWTRIPTPSWQLAEEAAVGYAPANILIWGGGSWAEGANVAAGYLLQL